MKISLAGPSYTTTSVVAAAQRTINFIPELVERPDEPARIALYSRPGITRRLTLSPILIRGMWAGGGRLFVVHGDRETEVFENNTTSSASQPLATMGVMPDAAQIFSNGHQLMIVSGGFVYCDNGAGPIQCHFQLAGTGHTIGTNQLIRDSGDAFVAAMQGAPITVGGHQLTVSGFIDADHILLNPAPPTLTDAQWNAPGGAAVTASSGCFLDGYGIISRPPTPGFGTTNDQGRNFNISGLNDFTFWNPLDFGVKEGCADYIRSVLADHEELILFGTESTEIWGNIGSQVVNGVATFPFQRQAGAFIQKGSGAAFAPCSVGPSFCWLGSGPDGETIAYQAQGFQPARISTHAEEFAWRPSQFHVADAVSYSYVENGHTYWVVNFWQNAQSWLYDLNTGMWHERYGWNSATQQFLRYKAWYHVFIPEWDNGNGMHVVGDPSTGNLYQMSQDIFSDDGAKMLCLRACSHLTDENKFNYHHRLEVLVEMGTVPAGQTPPDVSLDWSDNHGHTFHDGRSVPMGVTDEYLKRAIFRRLGKSRDRIYRIGFEVDNCRIALVDTFLEFTPGSA